jgi:acetyltransferase-like isoleucine patch superfamily enzyme
MQSSVPLSGTGPGRWLDGELPPNVRVGCGTVIGGHLSFKRFRSKAQSGLIIGTDCTIEGVHFAIEREGRVTIGDYCYFTNALLLCELELRIGNYVIMGWSSCIADSDFHPIAPADRLADAIACSPLGNNRPRPAIARARVVIGDRVRIGAHATILKGVSIGEGAVIEPGALVTRDVPAHARVLGNPAQIIGFSDANDT